MAAKPTASSPDVDSALVAPDEAAVPVFDVPAETSSAATPENSDTDIAEDTVPE
jgi:hypothetical protein